MSPYFLLLYSCFRVYFSRGKGIYTLYTKQNLKLKFFFFQNLMVETDTYSSIVFIDDSSLNHNNAASFSLDIVFKKKT